MSLDKQIDIIFNRVDNNLLDSNFDAVNEELKSLNIAEMHTDLLIGYLTITCAAHDRLDYRAKFYLEVKKEFQKREETKSEIKDLLIGLKEPGRYDTY